MNIILFHPAEVELPLPRADPRAVHLLEILRRHPGDAFDAGLIDGPRGKGTLREITPDHLTLSFAWDALPPPLHPLTLVVGLPRPQTARAILREATALGVSAMHFVITGKSEEGYARSSLWKTGEWKDCVITGAAQAFCTRLPEVTHGISPAEAVARLPAHATRLALDNYESPVPLSRAELPSGNPVVVALGGERGWSARERDLFREHRFQLVHLGNRVLRTETACIAAVALVKAKCGWM